MIGWMIFYILAYPPFSFFLPLYSIWRMDDLLEDRLVWFMERVWEEDYRSRIFHVHSGAVDSTDMLSR
jgi:hypothetical protein